MDSKFNFNEEEKNILKFWEDNQVFKFVRDKNKPLFSVDTPPTSISGHLHIGHVSSQVQADFVCRFMRQNGFNVYMPQGWDDNGLPTERLVEKENNVFSKNLSRSEFIDMCLKTLEVYEKEYENLFTSLGYSADFSAKYQTISAYSRKISQRSFLDLIRGGNAYRADKPVYWCTSCQTSVSLAELEAKDSDSIFYTVKFESCGQDLLIATTRPEYLCACVAVIVNPKDERYKHLIGKTAIVPVYNKEVPVVADEKAEPTKGTGVVMCCTYGDQTDVDWCQKHGLPYVEAMLPTGIFNTDIEFVGGLKAGKARETIIEKLKELNKCDAYLIVTDVGRFYFTGFKSSFGYALCCGEKNFFSMDVPFGAAAG